MSEIHEATQILRVVIEGGIRFACLLQQAKAESVQKMEQLRYSNMLTKAGEASYDEIVQSKGGDIHVVDIKADTPEDLAKIKEEFTDRKILFCQLYDFKPDDGRIQFMIHASDASKVNAFFRAHEDVVNMGIDNYVKTGSKEQWKEVKEKALLNPEVQKQKKNLIEKGSSSQENLENLKADEIRKQNNPKINPDCKEITINEKLFISETEKNIVTRIPYEKNLIVIPKAHIWKIDKGKTYVATIDKKKSYTIISDGKEEKIMGSALIQKYDKVKRKTKTQVHKKVKNKTIKTL